jgi:hypothetical protein
VCPELEPLTRRRGHDGGARQDGGNTAGTVHVVNSCSSCFVRPRDLSDAPWISQTIVGCWMLDVPKPTCDALDKSIQKATILFKGILIAFVSASSF